jgi:imidazole glycerol-phosphate synthase subunit HisH
VTVTVVPTGAANLASVRAAFERLGAAVVLADEPAAIRDAERVVLPGVGAFGPAAARLRATGAAEAVVERVAAGRPTLAVCLGMQLLFEASDEAPGQPGLGCLPGRVERLPGPLRVPQMGWNRVSTTGGLVEDGHAYFANSFAATKCADGWSASFFEHAGPRLAAVERGAVLASQFHPELSGEFGQRLLERWLAC